MGRITMKPLINIFLVLFLISSCLTGFGCSAGKNPHQGTNRIIDDPSDELSNIINKAKEISFLKSLIVLKNNDVIIEEYLNLNGGPTGQLNDIRSAAKSILSAILGCAIKDGYIDSIDQKVIDFFPEYNSDKLDPRVYDLRIRHLITMRSGFDIKESRKVYQQLYASNNWVEHILHLPFQSDPGKKFNYHSFNTHLLSAAITKATGMSTLEYATQALFAPLSISEILWEKDPNGIYIGGWGLSMTARDMLKFGILYLNNGLYEGEQLISAEWVRLIYN